MRRVLLALAMLLVVPAFAQASIILNENYDTLSLGRIDTAANIAALSARGWGQICDPTICLFQIVSSPAHGGSRALRIAYPLPDPDNEDKIGHDIGPVTEFWARYYARYEVIDSGQPYSFCTDQCGSAKLHYYNPAGLNETFAILYFYFSPNPGFYIGSSSGAFNITCPAVPGNPSHQSISCNVPAGIGTTPTNYTTPLNQWVCVQYHLKMNDVGVANGIMDIWHDGVQTMHYTDAELRKTSAGDYRHLQVIRQSNPNPPYTLRNLYRYEDDYVLATTQAEAACLGSGDTTPPTAPILILASIAACIMLGGTYGAYTLTHSHSLPQLTYKNTTALRVPVKYRVED